MQPIIIPDVQLSFPEFQRLNQRLILQQRWWMYVLPIVYSLFTLWRNDMARPSPLLFRLGLTVFIVAVVVLAFWFSTRVLLKASYNKTPLFQQATTYTLSDSGILIVNSLQRTTISWATIKGVRKLGQWYILETEAQQGVPLDATQITAPLTEADLRAILQQHHIRFL